MSTEALVEAARGGSEDAWIDLIRLFHPRIHGLCFSMLGNTADADEAAQDAFVKAFESLSRFRGEASFETWLHRVAVNTCLDALRRRKRRPTPVAELPEGREPDPHQALEDRDLAAKLMARLSPEYRSVLTLREIGGLSYAEIAASLGCTVDSVKARLRRARVELDEQLRHF